MVPRLILVLLFAALSAGATLVSSNLFAPATLTSATNSGVIASLGNVTLPATTFTIQNLGLSASTNLAVDFYAGFATNQLSIVGTYMPSSTNATVDSYTLTNGGSLTVFIQARVRVATNSATAGVQFIQQH